jgi:acetylornithine deacetylase/succinyl-diaminopimelate desuccinylase-like protein
MRHCIALLLAFTAAAAAAQDVAAWRARHERDVLNEFVQLLALPNVARDTANIGRNAAAIAAMFERRGAAVRLLTIEGAPPIVVADLPARGATRTIAFYAHYDGQPVDPAQWKSAPWTPVMRDANGNDVDWQHAAALDPEWRLYARSAGDDKAPIVAMAAALDALRDTKRTPAVNLRFVFEGEEEAGSPHLAAYLAKYADALRADGWVLFDGPVHQSRRAELFFGARGVIDAELTVYGPVKALHDGHYGNWVANPIMLLTHLLDSMRDENGRILIKDFYADVQPPTATERAALARVPAVETVLRREFQIAANEGDGKPLNELLMLPALNVRGIESGHVGALASNTIQTEARASLDFRLVPAETPQSVQALVEAHIAAQGYTIVRETPDAATRLAHPRIAKLVWGSGYPPARTSLDQPLSRELASIMTAAGHEPVLLPTLGGSIPMYLFQQPGNVPVIGLPVANHDDNQHAPNENLRLQNLWDAIDIYAALFAKLEKNH